MTPSCGAGCRRHGAVRHHQVPGAGGRLRAGLWRAGAGPDAFVLGCFRYAAEEEEEEEEAGAEAQERARVLLERLREQARARQLRRQRDERPRGAGGEPAAGGEAPSPGSEGRGRRREAAERAAGGSEEDEDGGAAPAEGRGAGGGERGRGAWRDGAAVLSRKIGVRCPLGTSLGLFERKVLFLKPYATSFGGEFSVRAMCVSLVFPCLYTTTAMHLDLRGRMSLHIADYVLWCKMFPVSHF